MLTSDPHLDRNERPSHSEDLVVHMLCRERIFDAIGKVYPVRSYSDKRKYGGELVDTSLPERKVIDVVSSVNSFN